MTIHIGAHPSNLTLTALAHQPDLQRQLAERGVSAVYHWYSEGKLIHGALDRKEIDVIGTGSTRAIVAQADGVPFRYLLASLPRTAGAAILVPQASDIRSAVDLCGKRVGLIDGSFHTYFLVAALHKAGASYGSLEAVNWAVKDSLRALKDGEIDAWVASAPYLAPALEGGDVRSLIGCNAVIPNRSIFWLSNDAATKERPVVEAIAKTLAATDRWIAANPESAGKLFADAIGGVSAEEWSRSIAGRQWGLVWADDTVLTEQQTEADLLAQHGLLPRKINVRDAAFPGLADLSLNAA